MAQTRLVHLFVGILLIGSALFSVPAYAGVGATPSAINFGSVAVSTSSTAATITITNNSRQSASIQQVTSTLAQFAVLAPAMPLSLAPRSSTSFQVVFTPSAATTFSGTIVITPGHKAGGPISIGVSGVGAASNSTSSQSFLLSANTSSLSFGSILVGSPTSQAFTLTNTGTGSVSISQVAATGAGFTVSGFPGGVTLAAGQSLPLTANYSPVGAGAVTGSISVVSTATNSPLTISLSGTGVQPQISVAPSSLSFGNLVVGTNGTQKLTISNPGTATLSVTQAALAGTAFSTSGLALPLSIAPGGTASFNISFAPASAGSVSGSITLISNAATSSLVIPLSGSGVAATLQLSVSPTSMSFGNLVTGSSATQNVTISNTGNSSVSISQVSETGTGFSVSGITLPVSLAAGQSTSFGVKFTPASAGSLSGSVTVASNASNSPATITLSGTGVQAQIAVVPSSVSFGSVTVGVPNSQTLTIQNPGTATLSVTQASLSGTGFTSSGLVLPLSVPAGGSATFNVGFTPAAAGSVSGSITLISNTTNSPLVVPFSGTGIASTLQLSASPASLSFGSLTTGTSATKGVTISNTGNSSVSISQISASGTGYATSAVALPLSLAAGQSTSFNVTFDPASTGSLSGSVTVVSNATNSPLVIALSGTGASPVSHSVALSWTPSSSTFLGFNVYRGTTSGGPYAKVDTTTISSTSYLDAGVSSGQTYYYVATEVDTTGTESGFSSEVSAVVP
jgi:HYDIN/CFA65/VesB-like, Ig-like domain/Abnormal spindle-like microcephaly-assoc'd, ASPM-SPD-2-Hydin/Cep192 domain 4